MSQSCNTYTKTTGNIPSLFNATNDVLSPCRFFIKNVGPNAAKIGVTGSVNYVLEPGERLEFVGSGFQMVVQSAVLNEHTDIQGFAVWEPPVKPTSFNATIGY